MTSDAVGVIDRLTAILDSFDDDGAALRVSQLAERSGLPTSTVSRLVAGLVREHYLERDGLFIRLGWRVFEMSRLAAQPQRMRAAAAPVLSRLRQATGATVSLVVRDGADAVVVAVLRGREELSVLPVGHRSVMAATVAGRAMQRRAAVTERGGQDRGPWLCAAPVLSPEEEVIAALSAVGVRCEGALRAACDALAARLSPR